MACRLDIIVLWILRSSTSDFLACSYNLSNACFYTASWWALGSMSRCLIYSYWSVDTFLIEVSFRRPPLYFVSCLIRSIAYFGEEDSFWMEVLTRLFAALFIIVPYDSGIILDLSSLILLNLFLLRFLEDERTIWFPVLGRVAATSVIFAVEEDSC